MSYDSEEERTMEQVPHGQKVRPEKIRFWKYTPDKLIFVPPKQVELLKDDKGNYKSYITSYMAFLGLKRAERNKIYIVTDEAKKKYHLVYSSTTLPENGYWIVQLQHAIQKRIKTHHGNVALATVGSVVGLSTIAAGAIVQHKTRQRRRSVE
jgi:hypothetical protein